MDTKARRGLEINRQHFLVITFKCKTKEEVNDCLIRTEVNDVC